MEVALEAGAEDIVANDDGSIDVTTAWEDFAGIKQALADAGLNPAGGEVTMIPSTTVTLDLDGAGSVIGLVDMLEDLDDVQNVYTNADIPEDVLNAL